MKKCNIYEFELTYHSGIICRKYTRVIQKSLSHCYIETNCLKTKWIKQVEFEKLNNMSKRQQFIYWLQHFYNVSNPIIKQRYEYYLNECPEFFI